MTKKKAAVIGSGNIGTDLLMKIAKTSSVLEPTILVGIEQDSEGLARARSMGIDTTHEGIEGLLKHKDFSSVDVVFDATSAKAHLHHAKILKEQKKQTIDLTPAAVGPFVVPVVNLAQLKKEQNLNMVTCGGQATIPIVHALKRASASSSSSNALRYAEIVASIASKSAGPGTRANIDEFTETTSHALCSVGGAAEGKAIIVLNPAEPAVIMRDTVIGFLAGDVDEQAITKSIDDVVAEVARYVPGYRLVKRPVFDRVTFNKPGGPSSTGTKVSVFLEVEGAGHWLPKWAGNLDIMTSAALRTGEVVVSQ